MILDSNQRAAAEMTQELLERGQVIHFCARGQSMWPYIQDGDQVFVGPARMPLRVGDVVFVPNAEFGQLHRVVAGPIEGRVKLRGDALVKSDGWIPSDRVAGALVAQRRRGREIALRTGRATVRVATVLGRLRRLASRIRTPILGNR